MWVFGFFFYVLCFVLIIYFIYNLLFVLTLLYFIIRKKLSVNDAFKIFFKNDKNKLDEFIDELEDMEIY